MNNMTILEEIESVMSNYFTEKATLLKMTSGDISPEQEYNLKESYQKIATVVSEWIEQNKKI